MKPAHDNCEDEHGLVLLQALVKHYISDEECHFTLLSKPVCIVYIRDGCMHLHSPAHFRVCGIPVQGQTVSAFLLECCCRVRRRSQYLHWALAQEALLAVIRFIACCVECKRETLGDGGLDHLALPVRFRVGSKRPRKINPMFKLAVSSTAAATTGVRSAQQLLAGCRIWKGAHLKHQHKPIVLKARSGKSFCQSNCLHYIKMTNRCLGKAKHGYLGCDATTFVRKHVMWYAFEAVGEQKAVWLVPKVHDTQL